MKKIIAPLLTLKKIPILLIILMLAVMVSASYSTTVNLTSGIAFGFQDEGTLTQDHTSLLSNLDNNWAPSTGGTVTHNYYATGTSSAYWDAISLNFDLSSIGYTDITSATLRFYTQQGSYNTSWHHYEILKGAYNTTHEDNAPGSGVGTSFGNYGVNGTVGWLSDTVPLAWITGDNFDVTLRLWNARIDKVELQTNVIPEPGTLLLLGTGLLGFGVVSRLRRKKK